MLFEETYEVEKEKIMFILLNYRNLTYAVDETCEVEKENRK